MISVRKLTKKEKKDHTSMEYVSVIMGDHRYYTQKAMEELHKKIGDALTTK